MWRLSHPRWVESSALLRERNCLGMMLEPRMANAGKLHLTIERRAIGSGFGDWRSAGLGVHVELEEGSLTMPGDGGQDEKTTKNRGAGGHGKFSGKGGRIP